MALAWKAGWVHALTSSNLVSSATTIPALTRAGIAISGSELLAEARLCAIFALNLERSLLRASVSRGCCRPSERLGPAGYYRIPDGTRWAGARPRVRHGSRRPQDNQIKLAAARLLRRVPIHRYEVKAGVGICDGPSARKQPATRFTTQESQRNWFGCAPFGRFSI